MVRANIKGVFRTKKKLSNGSIKEYWYHRATGARLNGSPGTNEFLVAVAQAESSISHLRHDETLIQLIRDYTLSIEFKEKLAKSTQSEYRRMLKSVEKEFGDLPRCALDDPRVRRHFLDWREKIALTSGEREADHRLSAISAMLTWAVDRGHAGANHLKGFKRLYSVDRSELIWLPEHIDAFMKVAPIEMQRALIIGLHTGQRQGDILLMPWSAYDGSHITLRQGKSARGGKRAPQITVKCSAALCRMLDGMPQRSPLILTTKSGKAFQKRWFAKQWETTSLSAGITDLHFHDLRGTAVTMLSEAGNTPQMIATITGHSIKTIHTIIEKYLARTKHLSDAAIFNFENSPRTKFANQMQTAPVLADATNGKRTKKQ